MGVVIRILKRLSSKLPIRWQQGLKKIYFRAQIRKGTFATDEKEYFLLENWIQEGDWVLDVGANIGHYSYKLSEIVGDSGRVLAFEPINETFSLLAANVALFPIKNVSLINTAASETSAVLGMSVPKFDTGLNNYYMAHLTKDSSGVQVLCIAIDNLDLPHSVKLVKIDAEGHELSVLKGMSRLLKRDHPVLIVEGDAPEVTSFLREIDYTPQKIKGSWNTVFQRL